MTATYDGHLVLRPKAKAVEPCCAPMHRTYFARTVYLGAHDKRPALMLRIGDKSGLPMVACPFCGASVEVGE